jgi:hypothetical protein
MPTALLRRLAPLGLLAVPLLIPVLAGPSDAANRVAAKAGAHATTSAGATLAASKPVAVVTRSKVAFGTSLGTSTTQTIRLFPNARVGRVFMNAPRASLPKLPASYQIWLSFNTSPSMVASGRFDAAFAGLLKAWNASGRTVYWTWYHEADRLPGISSAQFRAGWAHLLAVEKKHPSPRVRSMSILTGIMLAPGFPHGNPALWYVNADVLGFDCYVPASIQRAMTYARGKHKAWAVPEFGAHKGDAGDVAYIKSTIGAWAAYPPIGAAWYNNTAAASFSQPLRNLPKTTAFLRSLAG